MTFQRFITLTLLCVTVGCTSRTAQRTHSFGLYLTTSPVDRRLIAYGTGDWTHVALSETPVISDADIVDYDFTTHSLRVTPAALARIPRPLVEGTPFVVVADGQRIYLGVFTTGRSSMSFAVPNIMVDRRAMFTNQPADTVLIERAYPSSSFGVGPDPRSDARVRQALAALQKLK